MSVSVWSLVFGGGWGIRSDMVGGLPPRRVVIAKPRPPRKPPLMTEDDRTTAARRAEFLG